MRGPLVLLTTLILFAVPQIGCGQGDASDDGGDKVLRPGMNDLEAVQTRLIEARPGDVIVFGEGTFRFTQGLSLSVNKVTLRGQGRERTVLSFAGQTSGSQGILVTADDFLIEDLAVEDTAGDAIKVTGARGVTFRRVRVEWKRGPDERNGAYGLYPVQCKDVLIEECEVKAASDAGIYVGQSDTIIVRRNRAEDNVAGIEIENSKNADVYENIATHNTGGILVFDLPGLDVKNGQRIRVYNNTISDNNTDNFAPAGNTVAAIPRGTGTFIMATDQVELFANTYKSNKTVNVAVISYLLTGLKYDDPKYDPYPETIFLHDNTFDGGGDAPDPTRELGLALAAFVKIPVPDIIYDGIVNPMKLVGGELPAGLKLCIKDNKSGAAPASFANIDGANLPAMNPKVSRDPTPHACTHAALPKIIVPGASG